MKKRMKSASAAVIASVLIMGNLWGTTGDLGTAKAAEFSPVTEEQQKLWDKMEEEQKAGYNPSIPSFISSISSYKSLDFKGFQHTYFNRWAI